MASIVSHFPHFNFKREKCLKLFSQSSHYQWVQIKIVAVVFWICAFSLNDNRGRQHFESSIHELFAALNTLISQTKESMIVVQEAVLAYLPNIIGDVTTVYDPLEFTYVAEIFQLFLSFIIYLFCDCCSRCRFRPLRYHFLCGVDSVCRKILLMGPCRQYGSWSVAGHNHRKVILRYPLYAS